VRSSRREPPLRAISGRRATMTIVALANCRDQVSVIGPDAARQDANIS